MKHYAIFISTWNKDDVRYFDSFEEAQAEWDKICSHKNALKTDGGKNVIIASSAPGYLNYLYSKTRYQASWL